MFYSDVDKRLEAIRNSAREDLIAEYEVTASEAALSEFAFLNINGHEVPDPTIVDPPLGYIRQPDLMELMRRMIRSELSTVVENTEYESFEEADDFDIDDDPVDYSSPYEEYFDPAPDAPRGPPGQIHPDRQDPNSPPPAPEATTPPASSSNEPAPPPTPSK